MKTGAVGIIAGLVVGFLVCWMLTRSPVQSPGSPTAADTASAAADQIQSHADSLQAKLDSTLAQVGDSTKKYKDRADSLRAALLARRASRGRAQPSLSVPTATPTDTYPGAARSSNPVDTTIPIIIDTLPGNHAELVGPRTYEECMEDLNTVDEETASLRDALTSCEADVERLSSNLITMRTDYNALLKFRVDTFPEMVKQIRAEPRECKENWGFFKVKCSTAGWVKFGGGTLLGIVIAR